MCLSDLSPASCLRTIICSSLFLAFQVSGASQATLCITPCFPIPLPVFAQPKDLLCFSSNHFLPTVLHASCHPDLPPPRLSFTSAPFPTLFFQLATEPSLCRTSYWGLFLHPSPLISLHCHDLQLKAPGLPCSSFTLLLVIIFSLPSSLHSPAACRTKHRPIYLVLQDTHEKLFMEHSKVT